MTTPTELQDYIHKDAVNEIISKRLHRERAKQQPTALEEIHATVLNEIHDELRDLRVMLATVKDTVDTQNKENNHEH